MVAGYAHSTGYYIIPPPTKDSLMTVRMELVDQASVQKPGNDMAPEDLWLNPRHQKQRGQGTGQEGPEKDPHHQHLICAPHS